MRMNTFEIYSLRYALDLYMKVRRGKSIKNLILPPTSREIKGEAILGDSCHCRK